ncbi:MAG TPA: hypothetical protein VLZ07_05455 [Syntrophales bacterium]|nr:hypothetical protein [Syntrophales bacterium]
MKKLWIVLLSVALIAAFAMPVCAADVKFSGSYVAQGYYDNNRALVSTGGASVMNVWQRLRLQADFKVQEGLSFTTRADIMQKVWGAARSTNATGGPSSTAGNGLNGVGDAEDENIKFTHAYVSANIWGGLLRVGYQTQAKFGTDFGDSGEQYYGPRVRYDYPIGPWTLIALWDKIEGSQYYSPLGPAGNIGASSYQVDQQADKFVGAFMYDWGKGNAGLLVYYYQVASTAGNNPNPATDTGYKSNYWIFDPYVKAQFGPAYFEAEVIWITGKAKAFESATASGPDIDRSGWEAYGSLTYDFAPMYAGLTVVWVQGDDPGTTDKNEAGAGGGTDFNPCLMLFNYDLGRWEGGYGNPAYLGTATPASMQGGINNALLGQVFVGMKPVPKLDIKASYTVAQADQNGSSTGWQSKNYGSEFDITATYKIYDNLSYMVGFGYLWAGDYWKGTNAAAQIDNDYLITHKLTLSF